MQKLNKLEDNNMEKYDSESFYQFEGGIDRIEVPNRACGLESKVDREQPQTEEKTSSNNLTLSKNYRICRD